MPKIYNPGGHRAQQGLASRVCETCGASYQPYRASQRTCSVPCHKRRPDRIAAESAYKSQPHIRERKNLARRVRDDPERRAKNRERRLRTVYGLEVDVYEAMLFTQGGVCAICSSPPAGGKNAAACLHVDHDHDTGKVRALLCNGCNRGMGYMNDSPERLRAAADYIEKHKE